ncbi:MAG: aminoglycoside phosphotransferase family protein [Mycobacteriales bacterium]
MRQHQRLQLTAGMPLVIPPVLSAAASAGGRSDWLQGLSAAVHQLQQRWSLTIGEPFLPGGQTAWVAPATTSSGEEVVLKVAWRHPEALHEADGLREWNGDGTVRLHAAEIIDADTVALLLERCSPGTTLSMTPEPDQDVVIAGLLRRLWRELSGDHPFRSLQGMCDWWADAYDEKVAAGPSTVDPGMAREAIALFRTLPATADRAVLLCTDLHAGNVLAAEREPWLVIDPKPYVGDPTYDPLQHLLNCDARLRSDPLGLADRMADLLDLDRQRMRLWLFARCVQEAPQWPWLAEVARRIAPA